MRVPRLHLDETLSEGMDVVLTDDQHHYLSNVLRLVVGSTLHLFNARCGEFTARIYSSKKRELALTVDRRVAEFVEPELRIDLVLGISRGDRMDYAIQKSVELGVSSIVPMHSEFGEVRIKQSDRLARKLQHWRRIAVSASEQSGRLDIPEISTPAEFGDCLEGRSDQPVVLFDPAGEISVKQLPVDWALTVMIGPEGGFSPAELKQAKASACHLVQLGPRVLRTETAPVAALAALQVLYGDF